MKPILNILDLYKKPIFDQLRWEEALLRVDNQNWCLINRGTPPAIVMGISGNVKTHICHKKLSKNPLPVIRRFSGGGTVVVDEETLFVTFICQTSDLKIAPFPKQILGWTAGLYSSVFPISFFQLKENDYVIGEKKFGGNAQSIIKGRWLHHSSLLWDFRKEFMEYLLLPNKMPVYRQGRTHEDFLCRLKEFCPDKNFFFIQLFNQLNKEFTLIKREERDVAHIISTPHRQATCYIYNPAYPTSPLNQGLEFEFPMQKH